MAIFDFYLDTKVTTWYRTPFEIEADTLEEAKEGAINFVENDHHSEISWEHIDDTIEKMSVWRIMVENLRMNCIMHRSVI